MTKAIEAVAVAIWERDPDMNAPSDAVGKAEGIIAALKANGYAVVPVEASKLMREVGADNLFGSAKDDWGEEAADIWSAMIAAATTHDDGGE